MTRRLVWRPHSVLGAVLLIWLAVVAGLLICGPILASTSALPAGVRTQTWTFSPGDFQKLDDTYLSTVARAPFPFTASGVHLGLADGGRSIPGLELRLKADGGEWSPWFGIDELEPEADGRLYGENLVAWPQSRQVQVRIHSLSLLEDAIRDLTIIAIDTYAGPTTAQAALSASGRTASQAGAVQGDPGIPQPTVISRDEWGANESWMTWTPYYEPVEKVIVHHTVTSGGDDPAAEVRAIYYYHAVTRGWGDIGYNYLADRFGNLYQGRYGGPDVVGGHVSYWNEGSLGVSVLGCYDNGACGSLVPRVPTEETLTALTDLIAWASSRQAIDPRELKEFYNGYSTVTNYVLSGHRDFGLTTCPGGNLYAELPDLRERVWDRLPEYDVRFGQDDTPSTLEAGQQVGAHIDLYNHGHLMWSDANGVRLGYRWIKDGQVVKENRSAARIIPGAVVNFGGMTALVPELAAPATSGAYTLRWDLYREGAGWFAEQPAPAGRSQPLDLAVEVTSSEPIDINVHLAPQSVAAGAPLHVDITIEGGVGQAFDSRTQFPPGVRYVVGSGHSDSGDIYLESGKVIWTGNLSTTTAQADFNALVSSGLGTPLALSTVTSLTLSGRSPLVVTRWFIVDAYHCYLPEINRALLD